MNSNDFLKNCVIELKRCGISLLLIVLGVFLATANAPAAPVTSAAKSPSIGVQPLRPLVVLQPLIPAK